MQATPQVFDRQLTELDFVRLRKLVDGRDPGLFADVLDLAEIVPSPRIDPDVVTMYSQFEFEEDGTRKRRVLAVCYPQDAEPSTGFISVLSPLGSSLIGRRAGAQVQWDTPAGPRRGFIAAVLFQPEASGDYVT
ncbi:GreA/GreB family elongation factor [Ramlibacter humi]|uniref:Transcription elongation factor GreAB n=1 Tax=Ramlibacter humi TaxID=2530451 RepID=A0A4Z0C0H8_9BURK|nr:GreA/GreB family elongation factor [Ramlibacter humi]TFZ03745.1 transcription elongation factor GreAB [Ramlibacter humi]